MPATQPASQAMEMKNSAETRGKNAGRPEMAGPLLHLQEARRSRSRTPSPAPRMSGPASGKTMSGPTRSPHAYNSRDAPRSRNETNATDGGPLLHTEPTIASVPSVQAHPQGEVHGNADARSQRLSDVSESQKEKSAERVKKAEEESTGFRTHLVVHGARLVFLLSHSLVVLLASLSLEEILKGDHLTAVGATTCDLGATLSVDACPSIGAAVVAALGQTPGQDFTQGEYSSYPSGCIVAGGTDYRVVYNTFRGGAGNSEFAIVCAAVATWFELFIPIYIGNLACIGLLVFSVFASCKYIKRAQKAGRVRLGPYPSLLTDLLPEIGLSILGVVVMLIVCAGEWTLMRYLSTENVRRLIEALVFLTIVCLLGTCHGLLLTHNSVLYLTLAASVFLSLVIYLFVRSGSPETESWTLIPWVLATSVLSLASMARLGVHWRLLSCEERLLRFLEAVLLAVCTWGLGSMGLKMHGGRLHEAGDEGVTVGGCLCFIVLLRARLLLYWELRRGTVDHRVIEDLAVPGEGIFEELEDEEMPPPQEEIQLGEVSDVSVPESDARSQSAAPPTPAEAAFIAGLVDASGSPRSPTVMTV